MGDSGVGSNPYYWDYLRLDDLLGAQRLESARHGRPAHDEMLFIVVHQVYELWFKQILWELDGVLAAMAEPRLDDDRMGQVVRRLQRIVAIQPLLMAQLDVIETMTPLDFLDFRGYLAPASGFQSLQFRLIENKLGISPQRRARIGGMPYTAVLREDHRELLERSAREPNLLSLVEGWLARTPFLRFGSFDFWQVYRRAVEEVLAEERAAIDRNPHLGDDARAEQLARHRAYGESFAVLFDRDAWEARRASGERRLSHDAFLAALLISLYRDAPAFQLPFSLLTALVDIDEGFTAWRQRHALMAFRMIGGRVGTGGTSGHRYLEAAAERHSVFRDLFALSGFLLPTSKLPDLPADVKAQLGFRYQTTTG
jgi:tryptophan 2,3-dioxygenase